ncbi:MAG: amidohydrolase [Candidatus Kapabacteria bacterium]|nr:amidohydrolase [Candidatus Kapabacteria bacterium]MDW8012519.1 amidohydrolase [Bacteroidota bacterium]
MALQAQQLWLRIRGGRIWDFSPAEGEVVVETEAGRVHYPGCWILPGFVDAHGHIVHFGLELVQPRLQGCRSAEECLEVLRCWEPNRGEWLVGRGWNHEEWAPAVLPTAAVLDTLFPDVPVALSRTDGHALWVNSEALRRAGITAETPDPSGGLIVRDASGMPTGVLVDTAMELVLRCIPPPSPEEVRQAILRATAQLLQYGITEVHDMDVDVAWVPIFQELAQAGHLSIRVQSYVRAQRGEWAQAGLLPATGEFFQLRGVKFYADGALGSYGAALLEPYADFESHKGFLLFTTEGLELAVAKAMEVGWHVAIHAIGDAANRQVAHVYAAIRQRGIGELEQRLRIEHAQLVHPEDIPVMVEAGCIASVQPLHCVHDAPMARRRLGYGRASIPYPWRSLLEAGLPLAAGSDFPVEPPNVLAGISAFCTRRPPSEAAPWMPEECLRVDEALAAYTTWAHYASGMEDRRGLLLPGYDADFVIVDANPAEMPPEEIASIGVVAVYVAGERRWVSRHM